MQERLQKIIAQAGVCSRRDAEQLILDRAVTVNGKIIAELGAKADPETDVIELRGHGRLNAEQLVYILINKPQNVVTTVEDPLGRRTVLELVDMVAGKGKGPADLPRLYPVGRLDFDAEGALILTNDGELAHMLMHPSHNVPKVYQVKIKGQATEEELERLRNGVRLPDMNGGLEPATSPAEVEVIKKSSSNSWLQITIHEGRHHQVKRMCQAVGHYVIHLTRVAYANLTMDGLESGHWRHLSPAEVAELKQIAISGLSKTRRQKPRRNFAPAPGQEVSTNNHRPTKKTYAPTGKGGENSFNGGHRSQFNRNSHKSGSQYNERGNSRGQNRGQERNGNSSNRYHGKSNSRGRR